MALDFTEEREKGVSRILLAVLLVVSLVLATLYMRESDDGFLHSVQNSVHGFFAPLVQGGSYLGAGLADMQAKSEDEQASAESITALKQQIEELQLQVAQIEEYRQENERLSGLLSMKESSSIEGVTAQVIGRTVDAWNQTVTLNAGTSSGVTVGLTVMSASGVVGQVIAVNASTCTVRLITDPSSGVAALIQSTRDEGIVKGSLTGALYLENIDPDAIVNVGDVVLTSGLGGSFTRGLLIGSVIRVDGLVGDSTRRIVVAPNDANLNVLEDVIIVTSTVAQG